MLNLGGNVSKFLTCLKRGQIRSIFKNEILTISCSTNGRYLLFLEIRKTKLTFDIWVAVAAVNWWIFFMLKRCGMNLYLNYIIYIFFFMKKKRPSCFCCFWIFHGASLPSYKWDSCEAQTHIPRTYTIHTQGRCVMPLLIYCPFFLSFDDWIV